MTAAAGSQQRLQVFNFLHQGSSLLRPLPPISEVNCSKYVGGKTTCFIPTQLPSSPSILYYYMCVCVCCKVSAKLLPKCS